VPEVGSASLAIIPSFKGFQSNLESGSSKALVAAGSSGGEKFGDAAGKTMSSKFTGYAKTAAKAGALALAGVGAAVVKIGIDSVKAASDLEESTNKVAQVFGKGAERVFKFSSKAADALGQTNQQARDAAATFGIFGRVAKLSGRDNAKFAIGLTKLASDLASFNNTSPEQAIEAIGAALRGESEPIRAYGVLLDEATLKAEALSMGLLKPVKDQAKIKGYQVAVIDGQNKYNEAVKEYGKESLEALKAEAGLGTARDRLKKATEGTIPPLTQQQKVLAAQSAILKQTKVQQGDFARTSDGLANAQRRLTARWEDAKAKLGGALLPTVNRFVKFLLDKGIPAVDGFAEWFNRDGIKRLKDFGDKVGDLAGHAKDVAKYFGQLPNSTKLAALATAIGAVSLGKMRFGGGKGITGAVGSALGIAKGQPVYVTNWAQIGAAGGGGLGGGTPMTKGGKVALGLSRAVLPVAIVAYSATALKGFWDWNHQKDKGNPLKQGIGGGRVGEWSRGFFDPKADDIASDKAAKLGNVRNAAEKVALQLGETTTAGKRLADELFKIDKADPKVRVTTDPVFDVLFQRAQDYKSVLDGLDRTYTTVIRTRYEKNDIGDGAGSTQPPNRSGPSVVINHNGNIVSNSPRDYAKNMQRRSRTAAGGGVNFP
jgi:hypothetical protein